nr:MAG TPA: hypothetical protein [Caudoviricetes sp.]
MSSNKDSSLFFRQKPHATTQNMCYFYILKK